MYSFLHVFRRAIPFYGRRTKQKQTMWLIFKWKKLKIFNRNCWLYRIKMDLKTLRVALTAGTKEPICARTTIIPTCESKHVFPPMFGPICGLIINMGMIIWNAKQIMPVIIMQRTLSTFSFVSFGTYSAIEVCWSTRLTTGWRPCEIFNIPASSTNVGLMPRLR